jgi:cell division ATPase FtsA
MEKIQKLTAQIKALSKKLEDGKVRNIHAVKNKINLLKTQLEKETELFNWENYLSK